MFAAKKQKQLKSSIYKFGYITPGHNRSLEQARDNLMYVMSPLVNEIRVISIQEKENEIVVWYES
jgi:hypothetical protein